MNCNQVDNLLQNFIDGDLSEPESRAIAEHHQTCSTCEDNYNTAVQIRALVQEIPVPPHSGDFINRVLDQAANSNKQKPVMVAFTGAVAAGFAAWFIVTSTLFGTLFSTPGDIQDSVYNVLVSNETQTIKVAIESEHALSGVQISVELSPNLELAGFGNRTTINWDTQLKKGLNIINLPISGLAAGSGKIITRVRMNGNEKIMQIQTSYQSPDNVWYQINTKVST